MTITQTAPTFFAMPNVIENVVSAFETFKASGFKAIVRGAVFAKLRVDAGAKVKATRDELALLIVKGGIPLSSAQNYASRALTVVEFWRFGPIDQTNGTFVEYCQSVTDAVAELWGQDINDIKKSGPPATREDKAPAKRKPAAAVPADGPVALADASPQQLGEVTGKRLSELDTQTLIDLKAAIETELAARVAAAMAEQHEAEKIPA